MIMGYALKRFGSEREAQESQNRMAVTWACGTLRTLDVPFENENGTWYVCAFWGWEACETVSQLSEVARECLRFVRDASHFEGPLHCNDYGWVA
jgi:hypothetical protein